MFRNFFLTLSVIALTIEAQEIPDYKGDYTFTNSKFSMDGVRAVSYTHLTLPTTPYV